jgi:hypothetical protein
VGLSSGKPISEPNPGCLGAGPISSSSTPPRRRERDQFLAWLSSDAGEENAPEEFVTLCAIVGLGNPLERRAVVAGLCEPTLLTDPARVERVLDLLDRITQSLLTVADRRQGDFRTLRQALGYCWSVAAAASPEAGELRMERWFQAEDRDIRWVMRENLKKARLRRLDPV